jgi:hypothetical protein
VYDRHALRVGLHYLLRCLFLVKAVWKVDLHHRPRLMDVFLHRPRLQDVLMHYSYRYNYHCLHYFSPYWNCYANYYSY